MEILCVFVYVQVILYINAYLYNTKNLVLCRHTKSQETNHYEQFVYIKYIWFHTTYIRKIK